MKTDSIAQITDSLGLDSLKVDSLAIDSTFERTWDATCPYIDSTAMDGVRATLCDSVTPFRSFFEELHPYGRPLHHSFMHSPWAMGGLLLAFILLTSLLAWYKKGLKEQMRNFFMPTNNQQGLSAVKTHAETYTPFLMVVTSCLVSGLLLFGFVDQWFDLDLGFLHHTVVLGICVAVFASYNLLRWMLYTFVNWIFFTHTNRQNWKNGFSLLSTLESLLMLPIIVTSINLYWDVEIMAFIVIITYTILRFLLLYHSFRIFFPKMYGIVHLFAYLCTLEALPLLTLWGVLEVFNTILIVK